MIERSAVVQAHYERDQHVTVRPKLVEELAHRILKSILIITHKKMK